MALRVTIKSLNEEEQSDIEIDVDYVSFVNSSTYGPPPLIAPNSARKDAAGQARAEVGESVLYINTSVVPVFEIERLD
jgi:hypothetical protein